MKYNLKLHTDNNQADTDAVSHPMAEYPCLYGPMVLMQLTFKVLPWLCCAVLCCAVLCKWGEKNLHFGRWLLPRGGYSVLYSVSDNKNQCSQGFLCVAGPHVVAPKSPPVVCWPAIGPWQSAIGVAANHKPHHNWRGFGRH